MPFPTKKAPIPVTAEPTAMAMATDTGMATGMVTAMAIVPAKEKTAPNANG